MSDWLSGPDLARMLSISVRTVSRLARAGVLPREGRRYDPYKAVPAFLAYVKRGAESSTDIVQARLRLIEAQRYEIERRTRAAERRLLDADEVGAALERAGAIMGAGLDGLGGRLAGELAPISEPAVIRKVLFDEGRRIRNAVADELEAFAGDLARGESGAGAAGEDG